MYFFGLDCTAHHACWGIPLPDPYHVILHIVSLVFFDFYHCAHCPLTKESECALCIQDATVKLYS